MKKVLIIILSVFTTISLAGCKKEIEPEITTGIIRGRVMTDLGEMLTAGIIITDEAGNMQRHLTNYLSGYTIVLPSGDYTLTFTRGLEYDILVQEVTIEPYKIHNIKDVRLQRLTSLAKDNWYMGELHQHSTYSDGVNNVDEVLLSNLSQGFHYGFLTDHDNVSGHPEWQVGKNFISDVLYDQTGTPNYLNFIPLRGTEVTTSYGHYQSLGYGGIFEEIKPSLGHDPIKKVQEMAEAIRKEGGIAQLNHPMSNTSSMAFKYWDIVDKFDTIEVFNGQYRPSGSENTGATKKWFELLNNYQKGQNTFLAATGGTDNHDVKFSYLFKDVSSASANDKDLDIFKRSALIRGIPVTVLNILGDTTENSVLQAIKNGNSFITNGPLLKANINGTTYGGTHDLQGGSSLDINLDFFSREKVDKINVIVNGEIVKTIDSSLLINNEISVINLSGINTKDWIVLEAVGANHLYAITNPIFIK